jgi:hypothetical protein
MRYAATLLSLFLQKDAAVAKVHAWCPSRVLRLYMDKLTMSTGLLKQVILMLLLQGVHPGCAEQQRALPAVQGRPQPPRAARTRQEQPVNTR